MAPTRPRVRPVVLCVIDGWGLAPAGRGNAIHVARTPNWDRYLHTAPWSRLDASGGAVGLPDGQMGNSEVGHLNLGAGRIVYQDIVRIDRDIREGRFADNAALRGAFEDAKKRAATVHLCGLVGPGGVHSHARHHFALIDLARTLGLTDVVVHAVLDGRDTPPKSAGPYLAAYEAHLRKAGVGRIASLMGRYWGMDRDQRWDRTERAYRLLVSCEGDTAPTAAAALERSYQADVTDEFVAPVVVGDGAPVQHGDTFVFVNFRPDRARQLTRALADPTFDAFATQRLDLDYVCMTQYHASFPKFCRIAYPPERPSDTLGEHVARLGLAQLRAAETEKYAHVTYFFSGGREEPFPKEERLLVPSPKVATYDQQPEMSTPELTTKLVAALATGAHDLVVVNYANPDMVGHTGRLDAAVTAVESVDAALGHLEKAVRDAGGVLFITADHGNVEEMIDAKGGPVTKHSTNPVPLVMLAAPGAVASDVTLRDGILADVAPTLLDVMGLPKPAVMDRPSLLLHR